MKTWHAWVSLCAVVLSGTVAVAKPAGKLESFWAAKAGLDDEAAPRLLNGGGPLARIGTSFLDQLICFDRVKPVGPGIDLTDATPVISARGSWSLVELSPQAVLSSGVLTQICQSDVDTSEMAVFYGGPITGQGKITGSLNAFVLDGPAPGTADAFVLLTRTGGNGAWLRLPMLYLAISQANVPSIPEPATIAMLGLGGVAMLRRRRRA